ncbi:hypothetical protein BJY52DRAFT_1226000 [Lactarius psammicola]|nr:hypothetical protein BJY52DRAFT_1226000 [Lactarius psammicola]
MTQARRSGMQTVETTELVVLTRLIKDILSDKSKPDDKGQDLIAASKELQNWVKDDSPSKSPSTEKLTVPKCSSTDRIQRRFVELRRALRVFSDASLFTFFLSTTGKISQISLPRDRDASHRMNEDDGKLKTPDSFIYLGFDHLMRNRKVFDKYKTL